MIRKIFRSLLKVEIIFLKFEKHWEVGAGCDMPFQLFYYLDKIILLFFCSLGCRKFFSAPKEKLTIKPNFYLKIKKMSFQLLCIHDLILMYNPVYCERERGVLGLRREVLPREVGRQNEVSGWNEELNERHYWKGAPETQQNELRNFAKNGSFIVH